MVVIYKHVLKLDLGCLCLSVLGLSGMRKAFSTPVPTVTETTPTAIHALLTQISIERSRVTLGEVIMEGQCNDRLLWSVQFKSH